MLLKHLNFPQTGTYDGKYVKNLCCSFLFPHLLSRNLYCQFVLIVSSSFSFLYTLILESKSILHIYDHFMNLIFWVFIFSDFEELGFFCFVYAFRMATFLFTFLIE